MDKARKQRKSVTGTVTSDRMDKAITVLVEMRKLHPIYKKHMTRYKRFKARDARNEASIGDVVRIKETRPLTKTVNWALAEIVEKAQKG